MEIDQVRVDQKLQLFIVRNLEFGCDFSICGVSGKYLEIKLPNNDLR